MAEHDVVRDLVLAGPTPDAPHASSHRRRGRPLEMTPAEVLERIRNLGGGPGLFRVHLDQPALYARARRLFGTWAAAVARAGLDYDRAVHEARRRALETRRRARG